MGANVGEDRPLRRNGYVLAEPLRDCVSSELKSPVGLGAVVVKKLADANMQKLPRLRVELSMSGPDGAQTDSTEATAFASKPSANYSKKGHVCTWIKLRTLSRMFVEGRTKKGRTVFTCETRETFGVHM